MDACSGSQTHLWKTKTNVVWAWDTLVNECTWNTNVGMLWALTLWSMYVQREHECHYGLGMDALVSACSGNTIVGLSCIAALETWKHAKKKP